MSDAKVDLLLAQAKSAIECADSESAQAAWREAEQLGGLSGVSVRERLGAAGSREASLSWSLWGAVEGNRSAMYQAACCYREGLGTRRDRVQSARWFLAMEAVGDHFGSHELVEVAKTMTDAKILEAGRLSGNAVGAQAVIFALPRGQRRWNRLLRR